MIAKPDSKICSWAEMREWLHQRCIDDPKCYRPRRILADQPEAEKPIVVNVETSGPSWKEINAIEQRLLNSLTEQRKLREQIEGLTKAVGRINVEGQQNRATRSDSDKGAIY